MKQIVLVFFILIAFGCNQNSESSQNQPRNLCQEFLSTLGDKQVDYCDFYYNYIDDCLFESNVNAIRISYFSAFSAYSHILKLSFNQECGKFYFAEEVDGRTVEPFKSFSVETGFLSEDDWKHFENLADSIRDFGRIRMEVPMMYSGPYILLEVNTDETKDFLIFRGGMKELKDHSVFLHSFIEQAFKVTGRGELLKNPHL